jgi:tRNA(adenine34) deaminase
MSPAARRRRLQYTTLRMGTTEHERFMQLALAEARAGRDAGEQPFGAVIVRAGEVVASARSRKSGSADATAHAELLCVGTATRALASPMLSDCLLYTTCEPCPMCCGAIVNTGVGTLVLGARLARLRALPAGQAFGAFGDYTVERMAALTASRLQLVTGVLTEECERLYQGARITVNG